MGHVSCRPHGFVVFWELLVLPLPSWCRHLDPLGLGGQDSPALPLLLLRSSGWSSRAVPVRPPVPAAAAALPSVEVHQGYFDAEFAGPDATRAADTEVFQRKNRGRGAGRKPNDVLIKMVVGAARLQPDWEGGSRIDRTGLTVRYSWVLGATHRRLREELERSQCIHLCRSQDFPIPPCSIAKPVLPPTWRRWLTLELMVASVLGEPGSFSAVWVGECSGSYVMKSSGSGAGRWLVDPVEGAPPPNSGTRVLKALDPDSESEAEVVEDPCQAVQVGLELQNVPRLLQLKTATTELPLSPLDCLTGIRSSLT